MERTTSSDGEEETTLQSVHSRGVEFTNYFGPVFLTPPRLETTAPDLFVALSSLG